MYHNGNKYPKRIIEILFFNLFELNKTKMKKLILSVAMLATMTLSQAQETKTVKNPAVKFGLKAGINYSSATIEREYSNDVNPRVGLYAGIFTNIRLSSKLSFQPEVIFSAQGYNEKYTTISTNRDTDVRLSYVNIPLEFQYKIMEKLYVETGPQIGFLLSAKADDKYFNTNTNTTTEQKDIDFKKYSNKHMISYTFGAGYSITNNLSASLRYNLGVTQIDTSSNVSVKNNVLQFGVAYSF